MRTNDLFWYLDDEADSVAWYTLDMFYFSDNDRTTRQCAAVDFGTTLLDMAREADEGARLWVKNKHHRVLAVYYYDAAEERFTLACQTPYPAYWYTPDTDDDLFDIDDEDIII